MVVIRRGARIARNAALRISCAAAVFDGAGRVLFTQRRDNGRWCLPAGALEAGESATEACEREVREETGLEITVTRLVGVYSSPDRLFEYPDGNRWHVIELLLAAMPKAGALTITGETLAARFCDPEQAARLDLLEHDRERLADVFGGADKAFLR